MRLWIGLLIGVWLAGSVASGQEVNLKEVGQRLETQAFIEKHLQSDGGFVLTLSSDKPQKSSLRATSAGIRSLHYFGGSLKSYDATKQFVLSCFDPKTGAFADQPGGKSDVIVTAVGLMIVAELKIDDKKVIDSAVKYLLSHAKTFEEKRISAGGLEAVQIFPDEMKPWIEEVRGMQNQDRSFGKGEDRPRMTGSIVAMLLRTKQDLSPEDRKIALQVLNEGQGKDGSFRKADAQMGDLETCYRIMRAYYLLGEKPNDATGLKKFIGICRNADGGYGVSPGMPSNLSGCYYAGSILKWLDAK